MVTHSRTATQVSQQFAQSRHAPVPLVTGVVRVISGRVALRAFDRGRGAKCATGRNSRDNFADDPAVTLSSGPLVWVDIGWDAWGPRRNSGACIAPQRMRFGGTSNWA